MRFVTFSLDFINGYKTYILVILAVVSGFGLILTKDYEGAASQTFQALTLVFGGASIVGLRHAVAKLEGPSEVGLRHAVADSTPDTNTA